MMKKGFWAAVCLCLAVAALAAPATAEEQESGITIPVITSAYELSSGKIYLEWSGNAPVYRVYVDGEAKMDTNVSNANVSLNPGTHTLLVYPFSESKNAETTIDLGVDIMNYGGSISLDLAALGLDPKKLTAGTPSAPLNIDYRPDSIFESAPDKFSAITDQDDRVLLSFTDRQYADEYAVTMNIGRDVSHISYRCDDPEQAAWIARDGNRVTLTMDPAWLSNQGVMAPEIGEKCTFRVQLRKKATDYITGEKKATVVHESKVSDAFEYTPVEAWRNAPEITYASQTADGEITLRWAHDDYGAGCSYKVMKINKTFGIKTGEECLGTVPEHEFVIRDLMNGKYTLTVVPQWKSETGNASAETEVEIKNDWVIAPLLSCEILEDHTVMLSWQAAGGVEKYHLSVYAGDNESLLRYIGMDYSLREEHDFPAATGETKEMTWQFRLKAGETIPEDGLRLRFELYGIRRTENGAEQQTGVTKESLTIKQD